MTAPGNRKMVRGIARVLVAIGIAHFMATGFRRGWSELSTDFPNYYTAAVAVGHPIPLRSYYDWTAFAREMNRAGVGEQVGAYAAQTPLTMLPMIGLAGMSALAAKHVWLIVNLALLAITVGLLARSTKLWWDAIALLLVSGYGSLASNFAYGQYYVFLLFLLSLAVYWMAGRREFAGGFVSGVAFALKLYTAPLLFYFAARRKWGAVAGMLAASGMLCALAVLTFGWEGVMYYLTHVLPRALEGGSIDPYNPGVPTLSTILHRLLMREPGLNPNPFVDAPWLFFTLRTILALGLITFTAAGVAANKESSPQRDFAWFTIAMLLLSTSTASYTFILLLVPVCLLLAGASPLKSVYLVASYVLLNINLKPTWLFPKVWLLILLYLVVGADYWRAIRIPPALYATSAVLILSVLDARLHMLAYAKEPARHYPQIAIERGSLFASYPAITRSGIFFQGMGNRNAGEAGYVLRWLHDGTVTNIGLPGSALHPIAPDPDGPIWFELTGHGSSTTMRFEPLSGTTSPGTLAADPSMPPATSPDGKWTVASQSSLAGEEIWVQDRSTGRLREVAGGNCNNTSPTWELDSTAIVFASDCGRAFGLPALYRARIAE